MVRTRVLNPKWIGAMTRHGYKGAFELAATVDYLFGYDATAHVVEDWMYERVTEAYIGDPRDPQVPRGLQPVGLALHGRTAARGGRPRSVVGLAGSAGHPAERVARSRRVGGVGATERTDERRTWLPFSAVVGPGGSQAGAAPGGGRTDGIGGVLLRGDKGSAKTTLARGLAALLPGGAPFVELPIGASEDRVVGTLDLAAALTGGEVRFSPGCSPRPTGGCSTSTRSICCRTIWWTSCSTWRPAASTASNGRAFRTATPAASC